MLIGVVSLFVLAGHFLYILKKVRFGHGLDYFTTAWGYEFNYVGVLILYVIFAMLIVLAPLMVWFFEREERDFKKKYNIDG